MGNGTRLRAQAAESRPDEYHLHLESGRNRGALSVALLVLKEPVDALANFLRGLHDPRGLMDLDQRLGRMAAEAPEGTAFLVGQENQVWVFPSSTIVGRRYRAGEWHRLDEPQVVTVRPGESIELIEVGVDEPAAALSHDDRADGASSEDSELEFVPSPLATPNTPGRARKAAAVLVPTLVLLISAGAFLWSQNQSPQITRTDAYQPPLAERVVGWLTQESASDSSAPAESVEGSSEERAPADTPTIVDSPSVQEPSKEVAPTPAADVSGDAPPDPAWAFRARGPITSSPLLVRGDVVFGCRDSSLYSLDVEGGGLNWSLPAGSGIGSSPAVYRDLLFVGTYEGRVLAVDRKSGDLKWSAQTGGKVVSSPCVVDGKVIVGSYDKSVYAFDAQKGTRLWAHATQGRVRASGVAAGKDRVVIGSTDGALYCLSVDDGKLAWRHRGSASFTAPAVVDAAAGAVFVGNRKGTMYCLSADSGTVKWRAELDGPVNAQPIVAVGKVLAGTGAGLLRAFDAASGEALWSVRAARGFDARPVVVGQEVIAPTFGGVLHWVDLETGKVRDKREMGAEVFTSPVVSGARIFLGTLGGTFHAMPVS